VPAPKRFNKGSISVSEGALRHLRCHPCRVFSYSYGSQAPFHGGFDKRFWNCFIALIVVIRASGFNYLQIEVFLQRCPNCGERGPRERRELTDVTPRRLASGSANSTRNYSFLNASAFSRADPRDEGLPQLNRTNEYIGLSLILSVADYFRFACQVPGTGSNGIDSHSSHRTPSSEIRCCQL
jgi:hypothetical protein